MDRIEAAARACTVLHEQAVAEAPAAQVLREGLRACLHLTGARTALFLGSAEVPEHLRNVALSFDAPAASPPLAPKLLEAAMRFSRPWLPHETPGDGNGTPPYVSEALYGGDRLIGAVGLAPCTLDGLGEQGRELLKRILQPVAQVLTTAVDRARIARLEADLRLAERDNGRTPRISGGGGARPTLKRLIGTSPAMLDLDVKIDQAAATTANVLILGETGTGKELVARAIHDRSPRRNGPFVDQHMGAVPEELIEAVFMGFAKDIHSLAHKDKPGLFERADKGSFFMDEVALASRGVQEKILRLLQERTVRRVGSDVSFAFDTRIIAATNRNLLELVRQGMFREDLYYRLKVVTIPVPPLRHHLEDLPALVEHFLHGLAAKWDQPALRDLAVDPAWAALLGRWEWPGNVRELENTVEEAVTLSAGAPKADVLARLMEEKRQEAGIAEAPSGAKALHARRMEKAEAEYLRGDLRESGGSIRKAAEKNGLSEPTMRRKAIRYRLVPPARPQE